MTTLVEIQMAAEKIAAMRAELKQRAMIYQAEEKEYAASLAGLPFDEFYHLPYSEWEVIRAEVHEDFSALTQHIERLAAWLDIDLLTIYSRTNDELRDFWELYKAEGLAVPLSDEELTANTQKYWDEYLLKERATE